MSSAKSLASVRALMRAHSIEPTKALGQNFLTDLNITHKIVRAAGPLAGHSVLEIGPGPGGLSRAILDEGPEVLIAVEQDTRLQGLLAEISAAHPNFSVLFADALQTDLCQLAPAPRRVIANLPYNIATPLLLAWLKQWHESPGAFASLTLMFQKEVVDRLIAQPRCKAYGRLSVMAQWVCEVHACFDLPAHLFLPPPKVTSTVAHFIRQEKIAGDFDKMQQVVAAAFNQRRKTLKKAMKGPYPQIEATLNDLGIRATARAEELSVAQFAALAQAL